MRIVYVIVLMILLTGPIYGQASISTMGNVPDQSAILDISSFDRGILFPRVTADERNLIPSPATGLLIYNTTTNVISYYDGTDWNDLTGYQVSDFTGPKRSEGIISISSVDDKVPDSSSILDVSDNTRGVLIPRTLPGMIHEPATGLIIYNTSTNHFNFYDGNVWRELCAFSTGISGAKGTQDTIGVLFQDTVCERDPSAILNISSVKKGLLIPRLSEDQRNAIAPVAGLTIYNTTSTAIEYYNGNSWWRIIDNVVPSPLPGLHVATIDQITWKWNRVAEAQRYKWNITDDYSTAHSMGSDTSKTESGLLASTSYSRYVWAFNDCGVSLETPLAQSTLSLIQPVYDSAHRITLIEWQYNNTDTSNVFLGAYTAVSDTMPGSRMAITGIAMNPYTKEIYCNAIGSKQYPYFTVDSVSVWNRSHLLGKKYVPSNITVTVKPDRQFDVSPILDNAQGLAFDPIRKNFYSFCWIPGDTVFSSARNAIIEFDSLGNKVDSTWLMSEDLTTSFFPGKISMYHGRFYMVLNDDTSHKCYVLDPVNQVVLDSLSSDGFTAECISTHPITGDLFSRRLVDGVIRFSNSGIKLDTAKAVTPSIFTSQNEGDFIDWDGTYWESSNKKYHGNVKGGNVICHYDLWHTYRKRISFPTGIAFDKGTIEGDSLMIVVDSLSGYQVLMGTGEWESPVLDFYNGRNAVYSDFIHNSIQVNGTTGATVMYRGSAAPPSTPLIDDGIPVKYYQGWGTTEPGQYSGTPTADRYQQFKITITATQNYCPEALALFAKCKGWDELSLARKQLISDLIDSAKVHGYWDTIAVWQLYANENKTIANLDLKGNDAYTAAPSTSTVNWTRDQGYMWTLGKYVNTNFNPFQDSINRGGNALYRKKSAMAGVYISSGTNTASYICGGGQLNGYTNYIVTGAATTTGRFKINLTGADPTPRPAITSAGLIVTDGINNTLRLYINGSQTHQTNYTMSGIPDISQYVCLINNSGTPSQTGSPTYKIGCYFSGGNLSAAKQALLFQDIERYMDAIGAGVVP